MSPCTVSSPSSFSTFLNQSVFSLCVTAWSHISSQKRLLSSAFGILLYLIIPSNSLNNLLWFDSNNRFCLFCFVLLPYLSSFAPTATNLCRTSSSTIPAPFLFTFNLWQFSAATYFHVLVQPRPLVSIALPIDPAYSRCVQLFPGYSPELPLYYFFCSNFFLISSISMSVSHLFVRICLVNLQIFAKLKEKPLFHPIFSSFFVYILFLWVTPYLTLSYNLVYCLFLLHSLLCLIRFLMTTC